MRLSAAGRVGEHTAALNYRLRVRMHNLNRVWKLMNGGSEFRIGLRLLYCNLPKIFFHERVLQEAPRSAAYIVRA